MPQIKRDGRVFKENLVPELELFDYSVTDIAYFQIIQTSAPRIETPDVHLPGDAFGASDRRTHHSLRPRRQFLALCSAGMVFRLLDDHCYFAQGRGQCIAGDKYDSFRTLRTPSFDFPTKTVTVKVGHPKENFI